MQSLQEILANEIVDELSLKKNENLSRKEMVEVITPKIEVILNGVKVSTQNKMRKDLKELINKI